MPRRRSERQRVADELELERLRPTPRRRGEPLRCEWAPRCLGRVVGWADDPGGTGWLPVCELHRAAAQDDGASTRERV